MLYPDITNDSTHVTVMENEEYLSTLTNVELTVEPYFESLSKTESRNHVELVVLVAHEVGE